MRYNAKKKIMVYELKDIVGDNGEQYIFKKLFYEGVELVCPMSAIQVKKEYGIDSTDPKKIILARALPKNTAFMIRIGEEKYSLIERTNFDSFNILVVDIAYEDYPDVG